MAASCWTSCCAVPPASRRSVSSAGEVMLVLGDNRPRLYAGMLAAGALGGYAMPAYPDATLDEIRHFVHEAGARFVLAEDQEQVDKMLELREQGAAIEHIIYDDPRGLAAYADPGLVSWDALQARGPERLAAAGDCATN